MSRYYKVLTNTNRASLGSILYKQFAAPGIDSGPEEFGVFNSGAGRHPDTATLKASPTDWANEAASMGFETEHFVGNYPATKAPGASSLQIRRRGKAPFGGFFPGARNKEAYQHPGGNVDHNAGADHLIAGGPGQASSFVRVNKTTKPNRGMKLPVMPETIVRGGLATLPAGGGSHEPLVAPLQPKVAGWSSIFSFRGKRA